MCLVMNEVPGGAARSQPTVKPQTNEYNRKSTFNKHFPGGDKAPAEYFTGTAWVKTLPMTIPNDSYQ